MLSWNFPGLSANMSFKLMALISILVLTAVAALLPLKIRASTRLLSVLNVMAGGVFLATGLCHLLAEAAEQFEEHEHDHDHDHDDHDHDDHDHDDHDHKLTHGDGDGGFPWPFAMCGIGFIVTLMMEQIAHYLTEADHKKSSETGVAVNHESLDDALLAPGDVIPSDAHLDHHHHNHPHDHDEDHGHSHAPVNSEGSIVMAIAIWLALSFHAIMEGLALGASSSKADLGLFIAIISHKGLESFALGTSLIRSNCSRLKYFVFTMLFSCMTPVGIGIGMGVRSAAEESLASAFISAFASGTFLYVAVVEVLINEFKRPQDQILKSIMLCIGFALMSLIAIWA